MSVIELHSSVLVLEQVIRLSMIVPRVFLKCRLTSGQDGSHHVEENGHNYFVGAVVNTLLLHPSRDEWLSVVFNCWVDPKHAQGSLLAAPRGIMYSTHRRILQTQVAAPAFKRTKPDT
jgi:hypothetical protein